MVRTADDGDVTAGAPYVPPPVYQPVPPPPTPAPQPPPPPPPVVVQAETWEEWKAAINALIATGLTGPQAVERHPLAVSPGNTLLLAFMATWPQSSTPIDNVDAGVITGPPIITLTGEETFDEPIADPTAYDGWEYEEFFGEGGGLSIEEASVKVLRGNAFVEQVRSSCIANGVDPLAAFAVAMARGISGGIGDNGNAYGPWQLRLGDGRIGSFDGMPPYAPRIQGWAWTRNGIDYAMRSMRANGAKGKSGHNAVHVITFWFRQPADRAAEYKVAAHNYDLLLAKGGSADGYLAGIAQGPDLVVTPTQGTPPPPPSGGTKAVTDKPTMSAWGELMDFFAHDMPFASNHTKTVSSEFTGLLKKKN